MSRSCHCRRSPTRRTRARLPARDPDVLVDLAGSAARHRACSSRRARRGTIWSMARGDAGACAGAGRARACDAPTTLAGGLRALCERPVPRRRRAPRNLRRWWDAAVRAHQQGDAAGAAAGYAARAGGATGLRAGASPRRRARAGCAAITRPRSASSRAPSRWRPTTPTRASRRRNWHSRCTSRIVPRRCCAKGWTGHPIASNCGSAGARGTRAPRRRRRGLGVQPGAAPRARRRRRRTSISALRCR